MELMGLMEDGALTSYRVWPTYRSFAAHVQ